MWMPLTILDNYHCIQILIETISLETPWTFYIAKDTEFISESIADDA